MITLELTDDQAKALHTFIWAATIDWNAVGTSVNRKQIYAQLSPLANQLDRYILDSTLSNG